MRCASPNQSFLRAALFSVDNVGFADGAVAQFPDARVRFQADLIDFKVAMIDCLVMRWSKLKQRIEDGLADCAKGRVEVWCTRYRNSHDQEGEAWITIDKEQVHSMGTLTHLVAFYERSRQLQKDRDCLDYRDRTKIEGYRAAQDEVETQLRKEGVIPLWEFNGALFEYLNMSLEDILSSDQMVVRAIGIFDKRLGKRRLKTLDVSKEHEIIQKFYRIRCALEGLQPDRATSFEGGHIA
ncbi:hypothetical protein PUH89_12280 [Rhodobacter capsulatus]|uniref:Uncharacterized protein n=1 Tax=Rhodobacter capsulatus TaxID=1061 RepID=A0A1G7SI92_RHOCA|nr:hypothetical protein [Rhodobacter capsulatus]WER08108.1 hypothetical protein PUH89_12280 [Rhodobacter capsulatus]SDG22786.1 hypothetical protein SAMN04244550_03622 [Rhodobacter capsulatus]